MQLKELTLKECQVGQLGLLKKLDEICSNLRINYFIMYGSLIGTVRHHGFIPWDDDIDIALKRQDYNKLIDYLIKNDKSLGPFSVNTFNITNNYPYYIARFCDERYLLKFYNLKYQSGLFIDLYPFDGMGDEDDKEYWRHQFPQIQNYRRKMIYSVSSGISYGSNFAHKIYNFPNVFSSKINGNIKYGTYLDAIASKYTWDNSTFVGNALWEDKLVFFEKDLFDKSIKLKFEDFEVNVPANYDKILKMIYGDYMEFPPVEERVPHHEYKAYKFV